MRSPIFISMVLLSLSCANTKKDAAKASMLNGTWVPVKEELGGKLLPNSSFENQKLVIDDSAYTFTAEMLQRHCKV